MSRKLLSTLEMLKYVEQQDGRLLVVERIIGYQWVSSYFIYHTKSFKNGKVNYRVDKDGETLIWTNYDFLEFYGGGLWRILRSDD